MTITTSAPTLTAGTWTLDHGHTRIGFTAGRGVLAKVRGQFTEVDASLIVGPTLEHWSITATVDLASVDTGNEVRDQHLRSADLLDVENRSRMSFRSNRIQEADGGWTVHGDLTIGDVTGPLALAVVHTGADDFFDGKRHAAFEATGTFRARDFGLVAGNLGAVLGGGVRIELDLEFIEP